MSELEYKVLSCPPKAEVSRSNRDGCTNKIKFLIWVSKPHTFREMYIPNHVTMKAADVTGTLKCNGDIGMYRH